MRGHIYRRTRIDGSPSRWYAGIDLPSREGRRRQQTTSHDTRRQAQAWLAERVLKCGPVRSATAPSPQGSSWTRG